MLEKTIEKWLCRQIREAGGVCYKFTSPGNQGVPDRLIVLNGRVLFVELKTETGTLSKLQTWQIARLKGCGAEVRVVRGMAEALALMEELAR